MARSGNPSSGPSPLDRSISDLAMSLSDLASIGSFVSGVAVVVSLVYLALQVRHSEKTQRALMHQARAERIINASLTCMQPEISETVMKMVRGEELSPREQMQAYYYMRTQVAVVEDALWQHEAGFLDQESLDTAVLNLQRVMLLPTCRAAWLMQRPQLPPAVRDRFDEIVADALKSNSWDWAADFAVASTQAMAMAPSSNIHVRAQD